ncbi:PHA/PHB synthase family protein [Novosphingobium piscinae]|uniref:Class I poly(R)-hydroxyalkanoic acid synthase n=2 Tax=Novosphingobium piscinae TaxID=1507448 RepID=A0A7X1FZP3_9SPHN|nr:class I poly(R)-hydroxyalkanoic acid synthase [Novosphingobium piscinae]
MIEAMVKLQTETAEAMLAGMASLTPAALAGDGSLPAAWTAMASQMAAVWQPPVPAEPPSPAAAGAAAPLADPALWRGLVDSWYRSLPLPDEATRERLLADSLQLWDSILGQYGIGPGAGRDVPDLPRKDRRFADPRWREQPVFALIHQSYLLLAEQLAALVDQAEGLDPARRQQLHFTVRTLLDALSPANFPTTNPVVLERFVETRGESLFHGLQHLLADVTRGQLTQSAPGAFTVGQDLATTPGKVIHETPLFQLIQYSPATPQVLAAPLVIFPPWINRFYILDLTPQKSFVRWAVEQGLTVLMVSWKSADASLAATTWDDYVRAQIEAIEVARARFKVPAVHTIGYCVAGTTLAATLAVLARRGEADRVASATFFTAQVDFELAGELRHFVDDTQLALIEGLARDGVVDGRYLASTFNLLRGQDLIWNYVVNNYLLGEDYRAFDLLHWNSDSTNLPAAWHLDYLRDLYRDNLLVEPDRLAADGTPIDLRRITTPCYIQAGREDHIAPPQSVWRLTRHLAGPWTFLLAGSGHIAGVVNPPAARKYQYWTNPDARDSYDQFLAGATEHPGSWWPHWIAWLRGLTPQEVPATGKRVPGGRGDRVIEDAPGRYVLQP